MATWEPLLNIKGPQGEAGPPGNDAPDVVADWNATSGPSAILNKPAVVGAGSTQQEAQNAMGVGQGYLAHPINFVGNIDTLVESGIYSVSPQTGGTWPNGFMATGVLEVYKVITEGSGGHAPVTQVLHLSDGASTGNAGTYIRARDSLNVSWGPWGASESPLNYDENTRALRVGNTQPVILPLNGYSRVEFYESVTWPVPQHLRGIDSYVWLEISGGGGSGGGTGNVLGQKGGGGSAGTYWAGWVCIQSSYEELVITVGAGGVASAASNAAAGNRGVSGGMSRIYALVGAETIILASAAGGRGGGAGAPAGSAALLPPFQGGGDGTASTSEFGGPGAGVNGVYESPSAYRNINSTNMMLSGSAAYAKSLGERRPYEGLPQTIPFYSTAVVNIRNRGGYGGSAATLPIAGDGTGCGGNGASNETTATSKPGSPGSSGYVFIHYPK